MKILAAIILLAVCGCQKVKLYNKPDKPILFGFGCDCGGITEANAAFYIHDSEVDTFFCYGGTFEIGFDDSINRAFYLERWSKIIKDQ